METWLSCVLEACDKYNYSPFLWDCNTFFLKKRDTTGKIIGFEDKSIADVYKK